MARSSMESDEEEGANGGAKSKKPQKKKHVAEKAYDPLCVVKKKSDKVSISNSILIESLVKNLCSIYEHDSTKAGHMYKMICDKLFQMRMIDESYQMKEFEGIRTQYQQAFFHLLSNNSGQNPLTYNSPLLNQNFITSHYHREFEEIAFIAGGGFGKVYRVKHKLDGSEYAVKKIPIWSEGLDSVKSYLSEVKTFASLNHPNIIQYKAAWLDLGSCDNENNGSILTPVSSEESRRQIHEKFSQHLHSISVTDEKFNESTDFDVVFERSCKITESVKKDEDHLGLNKFSQRVKEKWATLYIQMALCQSTLKQWLFQRNSFDQSIESSQALIPLNVSNDYTNREILKQLLKGLQYIHSKGIVHHDIKPSNIFIQTDNGKLLVQLGDFGLACPLQNVRHSIGFGTKLYAAPEQLDGICNPKSDMYSLGIVLFELVEKFTTEMEKNKCIENLKRVGYPTQRAMMQYPQLAAIITRLISELPQNRPNAYELLQEVCGIPTSTDEQIKQLKCQLAEKEAEILRLKNLLKLAGVQDN